jgi:diguanylate cyclase (GGDEF)-like protein
MISYSDMAERKLIIRLFAAIGTVTTLCMAMIALFNNQPILAYPLLGSSALFASSFFLGDRVEISSLIVLYTLYALMIYLVLTGGSHGTGPIWIFIVSPVTFFVRGFKRGIIDLIIFVICVTGAFYLSSYFKFYSGYSVYFPIRIIASFIIVALLSGFYEYFRQMYSHRLIELVQKNEYLATRDPLTNLPNRRYAMEELEQFEAQQQTASIIIADVDNFKDINDQYGHSVGDEVLKHLAELFVAQLSENDMVARWGGEEFLFFLRHKNKQKATQFANDIHHALSQNRLDIGVNQLAVTVSMGISKLTADVSIDKAMHKADELLYQAKEQGKNKTCV